MARKTHRHFRNLQEGVVVYKQRPRFPGSNEEENEEEEIEITDYNAKTQDFIRSLRQFNEGRAAREANRNQELQIPAKIELIQLTFHDVFDSSFFEPRYNRNFGLSAVSYTNFNTVGLFAIIDLTRFNYFIEQLEIFINTVNHRIPEYHTDIKFIKEFTFYSTQEIIQYDELKRHVVINLIDNVELFQGYIQPLENALVEYLNNRDILFYLDTATNKLELLDITVERVKEIADNFDIIQTINSYAAGIVRPDPFNMPNKSYGFEISNADDDLPIIGIIDTGISGNTPLRNLIINSDEHFNLTTTSVFEDEANHGTAVAALASLGKKIYPNHIGSFEADAKLLSIKTLNATSGFIVESEVIRLIREAHERYGVNIFTLTICYEEHKLHNEQISEYAYALDKICNELNILIFIAVGNNDNLLIWDGNVNSLVQYPNHFATEQTNLCSPAESMNNLTVGSLASNIEDNEDVRATPAGPIPAIYTRTFHLTWRHDAQLTRNGSTNWFRANKQLFKPDICNHGGDYDNRLDPTPAGLKILSTQTGFFFDRNVGTSYSTPLTANLAAKIIKAYPELKANMQTVKALIINSAVQEEEALNIFRNIEGVSIKSILGHGFPNDEDCIYSSENKITLILEDKIKAGEIKSYPINIPRYLLEIRKTSLLKVSSTICFKFEPLKHHHLGYCPIHLAFGVFRNLPLNDFLKDEDGHIILDDNDNPIPIGINNNKTSEFTFNQSWSQDYYFKSKILSNTQKVTFNISKKVLEDEDCTLKIAINAKLHKLLNELDKSRLVDKDISFSIVLSIEENGKNKSNRLYDELTACNTLEAINEADLDANLE